MVSGRVFTDGRLLCQIGNAIAGTSVSWQSDVWRFDGDSEASSLDAEEARCTVAHNLPGGGIAMVPMQNGDDVLVKVTMCGCTELGGWLPSTVVNFKVPDTFRELFVGLGAVLFAEGVAEIVV